MIECFLDDFALHVYVCANSGGLSSPCDAKNLAVLVRTEHRPRLRRGTRRGACLSLHRFRSVPLKPPDRCWPEHQFCVRCGTCHAVAVADAAAAAAAFPHMLAFHLTPSAHGPPLSAPVLDGCALQGAQRWRPTIERWGSASVTAHDGRSFISRGRFSTVASRSASIR